MKKMKRFLISIISVLLLLCLSFGVAGCKDKKYDVTIKVTNNFGQEWIFTPDISELTYEFEYTGEEMTFGVAAYNLPKHPQWSNEWFIASGYGANTFSASLTKVPQMYYEESPKSVCERGEYLYSCNANATSNLWKFRTIHLHIIVV